MGRQEEMIKERIKKLELLRKDGINPYPNKFNFKDYACNLQEAHKSLKKEGKSKVKATIAGRLMSFRDLGKIAFGTLRDSTGDIQIMLQSPESNKKIFEFFKKYVDSGDFLGISGTLFRTKRGELSVIVSKATLLSKSLLPLPEKWHGLQDEEERYRKRYIDLITNSSVSNVFKKRALILKTMRNFMDEKGFLEVETPLLQKVYGGALAKPFKTHIDAYDSDVFLSIAPELPLKKALVGGLGNVYEITKKFRNEGVDRSHNPEHMTIEWYQEYADYNDGMSLFKELIQKICKELFGSYKFEYQGNKIDVSKWTVLPLDKAIKKYLNEDVSKIKTTEDAKKIAEKHNIPSDEITTSNIQDELMKLFREKLIQPTFLTDYPLESSPLAKPKSSNPEKAEVFQPFIAGLELARAYSELNDPKLQDEHFKEQESERDTGNTEAMPTDSDFVTALEHGMPPACGVGIGIERVVMLFTDNTSIRDVILFPFMKPLSSEKGKDNSSKDNSNVKGGK